MRLMMVQLADAKHHRFGRSSEKLDVIDVINIYREADNILGFLVDDLDGNPVSC